MVTPHAEIQDLTPGEGEVLDLTPRAQLSRLQCTDI